MTVTVARHNYLKTEFFKKHHYDYRIETSSMDEYGRYHKEYVFEDGAIWYEAYSPEYVKETVCVKFVNVEVEIKMFRTEFWSSDNATSQYFYEKF